MSNKVLDDLNKFNKIIKFARVNYYMAEITIELQYIDPLDFFGAGDANLNIIKSLFPKLKLIVRGDLLKVIGDDDEIQDFQKKFQAIHQHYERVGKLTESDIKRIVGCDVIYNESLTLIDNDIIVYGKNGIVVKARTINQKRLVESIEINDIVFAIGPAGTGKTYTAVALAVKSLKNKYVKQIILTRPAVEAGENLGYLPGDLKDKLDPYLQPLYDALYDMIPSQKLMGFLEEKIIEIAPLAFMRGRTLDNAFVILDEAQNATIQQMKMFLTRMGKNAKFLITGDITQIDLPFNQKSGLVHAVEILQNIKGIDFIFLDETDVIRHKLVVEILRAYEAKPK